MTTLSASGYHLEIKDLQIHFGGIKALSGVSFGIERGVVCGLIGPNGAGKTSLFNCISGLYQPDSGEILLDGKSLRNRRPDQIADAGIARTFQNVGLFSGMSVLDNVLAGGYHRTRASFLTSSVGLLRVGREERVERARASDLLDRLGIADVALRPPLGLPYGTLKRVELAKALMSEPSLLILDEPANGLIHSEVMELGATVRDLARDRHISVLLVEHHMGMVMSTCEKVVVLNFGKKIAEGTPQRIQQDTLVIEAYLGGSV